MDTKWKNSLLLLASVILCLGGWYLTILSLSRADNRVLNDGILSNYAVDAIYAKENIKDFKEVKPEMISSEQVDAYRMQYGDLGTQVTDIQNQYQERISSEADKKKKEVHIKERDAKIKAVVDNFTDEEVVKDKIIQEEKSYIDKNKEKLLKDIEPAITENAENFYYYIKDVDSGEVYTNVADLNQYSSEKKVKERLKELGYNGVTESNQMSYLNNFINDNVLFFDVGTNLKVFNTVKKDTSLAKQVKKAKEDQLLFAKLVYVGLAMMLAGIVVLYNYINTAIVFKWLKKIPIDILVLLFLCLGFIAAVQVFNLYPYSFGMVLNIMNFSLPVAIGGISLAISFIAFKMIWQQVLPKYRKDSFKELLKTSFCFRVVKKAISIIEQLPASLKILVIGLIVLANIFVLLFYKNLLYMGRFYSLTGLVILGIFVVEIWFVFRYLKTVYKLLNQPKTILEKYQKQVDPEFSLAETGKELAALDELVRLSQKDTMQSEMLKTELLTNVSHDLRTPLTSIITYGDLLTQKDITKEDKQKYVEIINKKALRMKYLIDDLFEVTKMNNGEIILEKTEVNLGKLLQQAVSERSDEFKEHHLKMVFNKPQNDIIFSLDGERMWRVFDNMFSNVLKYAMPETRVYLKIEEVGNDVRIELKNISQYELNENAEELVEKFKRGDSSRNTEGSGLGLAIINSIVSLHNGSLEIIVDGDMFKLVMTLKK